MEKFKYGPLIYNTVEDENDSGNYWWPGLAPVGYDEIGIPIDAKGLQCLPIDCPVHPSYRIQNPVFVEILNDYLPSISEWKKWLEDNFIEASDDQIKRLILKWYSKQRNKSHNFYMLQEVVNSLDEMVEKVWQQEENNL